MTEDTRIAYGAACTWWGPIGEVAVGPGGLPVCPVCRGVLFEEATIDLWWAGVEAYAEANKRPDYRGFIEWMRGRCFRNFAAAAAAYERRAKE